MIDGGLWQEIRRHLREGWDFQRIESGLTGGGVPDVSFCRDGVEGWIELKWTPGWKPRIRAEQIGWAERRLRHGGRVLMLTWRRCDSGPRREAASELWIHSGWHMRHVLDHGLQDAPPPILRETGGPSQWRWDHIGEAILTARLG